MGHVRDLWTDPKPVGARTRPRNDRWERGKRWLATWSVDGQVRSKLSRRRMQPRVGCGPATWAYRRNGKDHR